MLLKPMCSGEGSGILHCPYEFNGSVGYQKDLYSARSAYWFRFGLVTTNSLAPAGTLEIVNVPSAAVVVLRFVPTMLTTAPLMGFPLGSVTVPVTTTPPLPPP